MKKDAEAILISKGGQTVRMPLKDVRVTSRVTQGVILAKLKDAKDAFMSATVIVANEDEEVVENADQAALELDADA